VTKLRVREKAKKHRKNIQLNYNTKTKTHKAILDRMLLKTRSQETR